jgi:hypothetical protein
VQPMVTPSAPPAAPERGPVASSGNTVAPGTNASVAFAQEQNVAAGTVPKAAPGAPPTEAVAINAQEAAAKAPDTASGDAAKAEAKAPETDATGKRMSGTAEDTSANSPRHGTLTTNEESTQMPKAGQANNHSSTALEADSGRGRQP